MKPNPHSVRTYRGMDDDSIHEKSYPYLDRKCEVVQPNTGTGRLGPSKSSEQNLRKPRPGGNNRDDDNELVKYMSNLPGFLQQMEKKSNIQDKALNFGVLDWTRLEKWKYAERIPGKYPSPQKTSSKNQSSTTQVRDLHGSLYSGKQAVSHGSRFCSPQRRPKEEMKNEKKGNKTCNQESGRLQDRFHERVKFRDEKNVYESKRKDTRKDNQVSEKESLSSNNNSNPSNPESILLSEPKHFERSSSESSQFTESRTSLDEQLEEIVGPRLSDFFCPQEFKSGELSNSGASESKCSMTHEEATGPSTLLETPRKKQVETSEHSTPKERASSPARIFSFPRGRMSRSLSFKDKSGLPQLSSTYISAKSGPVRPGISENFRNDPANACGRAKSSPLRRLLLDPLLKHKAATHVAETVSKGPSQDKKPDGLPLQALLQITLKNGLPSFKLVVNNSNDMLAAAVKRLPTSEKNDSCVIYAFYSVQEIRKKSTNWMNQGSKSKSCGLGYNVVGEMKISGSSDLRECVLYGVDPGQQDKQTLDYVPNKEIAAVVVRTSSKTTMTLEHEEKKKSSGIVVILPGGVHGVPIEGTPSSLVSRWRFGLCDCEGWDVGCKLRILAADERKESNSFQASISSSTIDHVDLYAEGGKTAKKPVFSLKPFSNGYYSIGFDTSISLLEAFSTCVAYITCLKFPEIMDAKSPSGPERLPEALVVGVDKRKTLNTFQEQLPAYVTCPPLSPAGRI